MPWFRSRRLLACLALFALATASCGEATREEKLAAALEAREQAAQVLEEARAQMDQADAALREARRARKQAAQAVADAEQSVAEADAAVGLYATDDVLFRAVQKRLLEDDRLADVAISATVRDGVVTLAGEAPSEAVRDHALAVARDVPGVSDVRSHITIAVAARGEPAEASH